VALAAPRYLQLGQQLRFFPDQGLLQTDAVSVRLTVLETAIMSLLCENSEKFLNAKQLYDHVWHDQAEGNWRARLDTQLANLRKKTNLCYEGLIENVHGRGYRLTVAPEDRRTKGDDPTVGSCAPQQISFAQLMGRLAPLDVGGALRPYGHVVVEAGHPLELQVEYSERPVSNILKCEAGYTFLLSAEAFLKAADLTTRIVEAIAGMEGTEDIAGKARFLTVLDHCRIVLVPRAAVDAVYVLNSTDPVHAEVYYCLDQSQYALRIKDRELAAAHAERMLRGVPSRMAGVIGFAEGVADRQAMWDELRAILGGRLAKYPGVLERVLPEIQQEVRPIVKKGPSLADSTSGRRAPRRSGTCRSSA
jgi:DNA-binding winged helix-turn-helix (wHTH) protein